MSVGMSPEVVETILSMERADGGFLGEQGGTMVNVPAFPANTTTTYILRPASNRYALISYWSQAAPATVPDVFDLYLQHEGHGIYGGNVSQALIDAGVPGWAVVTQAAPFITTIRNTSNLVQRAEYGYFYIAVYSEQDYRQIVDLLKERVGQGRNRSKVISLLDAMLGALRR